LRRISPALAVLLFSLVVQAQKKHHFTFHYSFTVKNVEAGKPLRIWIPLAHSDPSQDLRVTAQTGALPLRKTRAHEYGDWMLCGERSRATKSEYKCAVDYDVVRRERVVLVNGEPAPKLQLAKAPHVQIARFLQPDTLVPITALPAQLAVEQPKGATTQLAKAHGIYDYVFHTMRYDKTGTGWGHGDTLWACDSKRGNCTDF